MGREFALLGNYETSLVYYQGSVQQIHKLLGTINDPARKEQWQEIQRMIAQEYEYVKDVHSVLQGFKGDNHNNRVVGPRAAGLNRSAGLSLSMASIDSFARIDSDSYNYNGNHVKDPDVWPAPPPTNE